MKKSGLSDQFIIDKAKEINEAMKKIGAPFYCVCSSRKEAGKPKITWRRIGITCDPEYENITAISPKVLGTRLRKNWGITLGSLIKNPTAVISKAKVYLDRLAAKLEKKNKGKVKIIKEKVEKKGGSQYQEQQKSRKMEKTKWEKFKKSRMFKVVSENWEDFREKFTEHYKESRGNINEYPEWLADLDGNKNYIQMPDHKYSGGELSLLPTSIEIKYFIENKYGKSAINAMEEAKDYFMNIYKNGNKKTKVIEKKVEKIEKEIEKKEEIVEKIEAKENPTPAEIKKVEKIEKQIEKAEEKLETILDEKDLKADKADAKLDALLKLLEG